MAETKGWGLVRPIVRHSVHEEFDLYLHPPSGSWVVCGTSDRKCVEQILNAERLCVLDRIAPKYGSLLKRLYAHGIASKNGATIWSNRQFSNASNPTSMLILKMVGHCNMACTYCYDYNHARFKLTLPKDSAIQAVTQSLDRAAGGLQILFHGGEPLLAINDIKAVVSHALQYSESIGKRVEFSVQTNGTQFTGSTTEYLLENNFSVGVSLDGPPSLNDRLRITHNGNGTYAEIISKITQFPALLNKIGVLTTVTKYNDRHLRNIAEHFKSLGIRRWDITLFQEMGRAESMGNDFKPVTSHLIESFFSLLDFVENDANLFKVLPILHYLNNVLSYARTNMCLRDGGCGAASDLVSLSVDGTINACDCMSNKQGGLGNIQLVNISSALSTQKAQAIRSRTTSNLLSCHNCDWRVFCGGTCQAKVGNSTGIDQQECELAMAVFPEIFRRLALGESLNRYAGQFRSTHTTRAGAVSTQ